MSSEDTQERREEPTPRRRQEARRKGQVFRSAEVTGLLVLAAGAATLGMTASAAGGRLARLAWSVWQGPPGPELEVNALAGQAAQAAAGALWPLLAVGTIVALTAGVAQTGGVVAPSLLVPDMKRLNPVAGLGRMFSRRGLLEILKNLIKIAVAVWLGWSALAPRLPQLVDLARFTPLAAAAAAAGWGRALLTRMLLVLTVLAAADYAFQRAEHDKRLRMTRRELRDELKDTEGSPQTRARRLEMGRSLRGRRVVAALGGADVVVANPEHFAAALRYVPGLDLAPVVVTKGQGILALLITGTARRLGIPVVHNRPLARALYRGVSVGAPVPGQLYQAVAAVMAYVYQLRGGQP
ncbi:MAG: EscU/YscU/HrcU family type III secretion system export apparatus switch protein [bacterium]|nr:EscU/YscU/HrcU family type III secretion system export apparatus switch protein [bacterium]